jgi:hypothetical protein
MLDDRGELPTGTFEVAVYFADASVNLYQIRQWYEPLRRLAERHPVVVIARTAGTTCRLLDECPFPVAYARRAEDVERFVDEQNLKLVLYVNHHNRNFQMMRYSQVLHMFLNHGESEKIYMASNQVKSYDYTCVAGEAAVRRIADRLLNFDAARRLLPVGRPQVDVDWPAPELPGDDRTVVCYAPTWEGDRPSMSYTSLRSHGVDLVRALVATGRHRVIFKPHPRTGLYDRDARAASREIAAILRQANQRDPGAHHLTDLESTFGWHGRVADACICDISAVMFDWLATGKPLLATEPVAPEAVVDRTGPLGSLPILAAQDAPRIVERLAEAQLQSMGGAYTNLVRRHFGDTTPGAAMGRFLAACERVIAERDEETARLGIQVTLPRQVDLVREPGDRVPVHPQG